MKTVLPKIVYRTPGTSDLPSPAPCAPTRQRAFAHALHTVCARLVKIANFGFFGDLDPIRAPFRFWSTVLVNAVLRRVGGYLAGGAHAAFLSFRLIGGARRRISVALNP